MVFFVVVMIIFCGNVFDVVIWYVCIVFDMFERINNIENIV